MYIYEQPDWQTIKKTDESMAQFYKNMIKFTMVVIIGIYVIGKVKAS